MTTSMLITTIIECAVGAFIIWGIFHEDTLCDFEDMIAASLKRKRHPKDNACEMMQGSTDGR